MATMTMQPADRVPSNLERAVYQKSGLDGVSLRQPLATLLGSADAAAAFLVEVMNQARRVPTLHECTIDSIRFNLLLVAQLHLNPALPNEVYFIPRTTKQPDGGWQKELTVQYGYGGLRKLAMRAPEVADVFTREVCANDDYEPPLTPVSLPLHRLPPHFQPRGRVIGYYAAAQLRHGNWRVLAMSVKEVEGHADRYAKDKDGKFGAAWSKGKRPDVEDGLTAFDKMAMKTCMRMLLNARDLPLSDEVHQALQAEALEEPLTAATHQGYERDSTRPALSRPQEAQKTLAEHCEDLYGSPPVDAQAVPLRDAGPVLVSEGPPVPPAQQRALDPTQLTVEVEQLWTAAGLSAADMQARWAQQVRRFHGPIPDTAAAAFLAEQQQWVTARQRAQERQEAAAEAREVATLELVAEEEDPV